MNRRIQVLNETHFIRFNNWIDEEDGHLNPVFIGEFAHPGGNVTAFCKLYAPDSKGIINEITGYLMAQALAIPQPRLAFIASISADHLPDLSTIAARPRNEWINQQTQITLFCAERLDGKSAALHFSNPLNSELANDIANWQQYGATIALDENIAHTDRHFYNLIRLSKAHYAIIDNGKLISENWQANNLNPNRNYTNRLWEDVEMYRRQPYHPNTQSQIILAAEQHEAQAKSIEQELEFWQNQLLNPNEKPQFQAFLQHRTKEAAWLLKQRFGQI